MAAIFNLCDAEGNTRQPRTVCAELDQLKGGLDRIGENKLRILIGLQIDDALSIVDDVPLTCLLGYLKDPGRQMRQVNLPVLVGDKLLRPKAPIYCLDFKDCVGNHLGGVGGVHLDQPHPWLHVIEKDQLLDAVTGVEFNLLGRGIQNIAFVSGVHLEGPVGAGLQVSEQDLPEFIGLEVAQVVAVPVDGEIDVGHDHIVFAVILYNAQARELLVDNGKGSCLPGHHGGGVDGVIPQPSRGSGLLLDSVGAQGDLVEHCHAGGSSLLGEGQAGLNVLDGNYRAGQILAGVRPLLNAEGAIRVIKKCHLGYFIVDHGDILSRLLADDMVCRRVPFNDGVIAANGQGDFNASVILGNKYAKGIAVRPNDLKTGAAEGDLRPGLVLQDAEARIRRIFLRRIRIAADGVEVQRCGGVGIHYIVLQVTVLIFLQTSGKEHSISVHLTVQGELDAARLALDALHRIQHLEGPAVAVVHPLRLDGRDVLVILVHNTGAGGDTCGVSEGDVDGIVVYPGFAPDGELLLLVLLAVNGDLVSRVTIRRAGYLRALHVVPGGALGIDVLGCRQDLLGPLCLVPGQVGIYRELVDIPVADKVAPQRHLGSVKALVFVFQAQLRQGAGGVAAGHNAHHLGVAAFFLCQVADAFSFSHHFLYSILVRRDTVRGDFLGAVAGVKQVIDIILRLYLAIHGQVVHAVAAVKDVDLAQSFFFR